MLVLALDTSTPAVTVAVAADRHLLAERTEVAPNRHAERLAPLIEQVLAGAGRRAGELSALAVGLGPGPFTGLRVGLATAAALADALGRPVYGECSLDVLARGHGGDCVAVTDARRREVYWAVYDERCRRIAGPGVERPAALRERLGGDPRRLVGAGLAPYREVFAGWPVRAADPYPRAGVLAEMIAERVHRGEPPGPLTPLYLRRPDAVPAFPAPTGTPG